MYLHIIIYFNLLNLIGIINVKGVYETDSPNNGVKMKWIFKGISSLITPLINDI